MVCRSMTWFFNLSAFSPLCHADASIYSDVILCANQVDLASFKRAQAPQKLAGGVSNAAEELFPVQALIERAAPSLLSRTLLYCHFLNYSRVVQAFCSVKFSRGDLRLMKQTNALTDAGWFDRWIRASGAQSSDYQVTLATRGVSSIGRTSAAVMRRLAGDSLLFEAWAKVDQYTSETAVRGIYLQDLIFIY